MVARNGGFLLGAFAAMAVTVVLLVVSEPLLRPLSKKKAVLETIAVTLGISMIINEIASQYLNNGLPVSFSPEMLGRNRKVFLGIFSLTLADVYTIIGAVLVVAVLGVFMYRTMLGRSFRAMAQDSAAARVFGIPMTRNGLYGFAVTGVLAGATAVLAAVYIGSANPVLGGTLGVKALTVALLAGSGNLKGGLLCGLAIGVTEALVLGYLPGRWMEAIVYGAVMLLIIAKPQGLFGARV